MQVSSRRRGVALTTLQAAPSSRGVLRPTRGEGRATGRAVTGGDQKGKTGEFGGGWLASRGQTVVGWAMAQKVLHIGVHSRAKWVMTGACTWARSMLCDECTRVRYSGAGAGEAGSGRRWCEGDTELRELFLAPVQGVRWQDVERRRPRGGGARDRGGVGCTHTLYTLKWKLLAVQAAAWLGCGTACLVWTLVFERDAAQRRPRGERVVPSRSGAGGPRAHGGVARRHGGAHAAGACCVPCRLGACPGHRWWPVAALRQ
jgi:hypothetical protein